MIITHDNSTVNNLKVYTFKTWGYFYSFLFEVNEKMSHSNATINPYCLRANFVLRIDTF